MRVKGLLEEEEPRIKTIFFRNMNRIKIHEMMQKMMDMVKK